MMRRFVRAVIENARVTSASPSPPLSLRVDPILLRAANLLPLEEVEVVCHATGARFATWVDEAGEGSGDVQLHAGSENHVRTGDTIAIVSHGILHDGQTLNHRAKVIVVDARNQIVSLTER